MDDSQLIGIARALKGFVIAHAGTLTDDDSISLLNGTKSQFAALCDGDDAIKEALADVLIAVRTNRIAYTADLQASEANHAEILAAHKADVGARVQKSMVLICTALRAFLDGGSYDTARRDLATALSGEIANNESGAACFALVETVNQYNVRNRAFADRVAAVDAFLSRAQSVVGSLIHMGPARFRNRSPSWTSRSWRDNCGSGIKTARPPWYVSKRTFRAWVGPEVFFKADSIP